MKTLSQVQVEQRARRLSERKFSEACTRYETVLSSVEISAGEQQLCSDDIQDMESSRKARSEFV